MDLKSVLFGIVLGSIFTIILTLLTIFFVNRRFIRKSLEARDPVGNEVVKNIIKQKKKQIIWSTTLGITENYNLIEQLTKELIYEVSAYYYPKSKCPELEITLYEALDLTEKISIQLKQILDHKAISPFKSLRFSSIKSLLEVKRNIEEKKFYKILERFKLVKVAKVGYGALNIANPFYWLRRIIYTSAIEVGIRSIGVMTMHIVGEEANQLYSKKILSSENELLETELNNLIKEIEDTG